MFHSFSEPPPSGAEEIEQSSKSWWAVEWEKLEYTLIDQEARGRVMDAAVRLQEEGGNWSFGRPNPQLWVPLGIQGPQSSGPFGCPDRALCVPYSGLGLGADRRPRPSVDLGAQLGLASSRVRGRLGEGMASGPRGYSGFYPGRGIKRMRLTDRFSHQLIPFRTSCPPRPRPTSPVWEARQERKGWVGEQLREIGPWM